MGGIVWKPTRLVCSLFNIAREANCLRGAAQTRAAARVPGAIYWLAYKLAPSAVEDKQDGGLRNHQSTREYASRSIRNGWRTLALNLRRDLFESDQACERAHFLLLVFAQLKQQRHRCRF